MSLEFKVKVNRNIVKQLERVKKNFRARSITALHNIGLIEEMEARRRIAVTKQDPHGRSWAAWSVHTLRARIRKGTHHRGKLYDSGKLWRSIYHKIDEKDTKLIVGSSAPYAKPLQQGRKGSNRMPARPFLGMNDRKTKKMVKKELVKQLKRL